MTTTLCPSRPGHVYPSTDQSCFLSGHQHPSHPSILAQLSCWSNYKLFPFILVSVLQCLIYLFQLKKIFSLEKRATKYEFNRTTFPLTSVPSLSSPLAHYFLFFLLHGISPLKATWNYNFAKDLCIVLLHLPPSVLEVPWRRWKQSTERAQACRPEPPAHIHISTLLLPGFFWPRASNLTTLFLRFFICKTMIKCTTTL